MSDVLIGKEVGGAVVLEFLGKGAMGEVYRAYDSKLNTSVAIKTLKKELVDSPETIARFRREAQGLHKLNSPYIIKVWGIGETEEIHFIKLEYIEGESLRDFLDRSIPLDCETALIILYQITKGLEVAHRKGIIHRDIKPENILIDKKGRAKIADLGIAKFLESSTLTVDGAIMGTPWYLSPEQVEGGEIDPRTDLYSLGIMFYHMLTGEFPFYGETTQQLLYMRLRPKNNPPSPKAIRENIPSEIDHLCTKMMQKNRENRYKNAEELQEEIKRLLLNYIKMTPEQTLKRLKKYEEEWQELLKTSIKKGSLSDQETIIPLATKLIADSNSITQKIEGINLLKSIKYDVTLLNEDTQINFYLLIEDYKSLEKYDLEKVFNAVEKISQIYEQKKPDKQKKLLAWLKKNFPVYLSNQNRSIRKTCIHLLKKLEPDDKEIWQLFEKLNSVDDARRAKAFSELGDFSSENEYAIMLLRGSLWEEGREVKKKVLQTLTRVDKDHYEIWEETMLLYSAETNQKRKAIGNILKLQKDYIEWLRPVILDLMEDLNPMMLHDFSSKIPEEHQGSLKCIISMYLGRLLFDILSKNHPEPEIMQSLFTGFISRGQEEFIGVLDQVSGEDNVWQNCWDKQKYLLDFTSENWLSLPHEKQIEHAQAYQNWYAQKNGLAKEISSTYQNTKFEFILIPPGKYLMGSPEDEDGRKTSETQHSVTITNAFYLLKYPVTQDQWFEIMNDNPSHFKGSLLPVERISWEDSYSFCEKTGFELPTEAQWEYACRAGTNSKNYWGKELENEYLWYQENSDDKTHNVGGKKPNPFGLYDMIGNVWEWCIDSYSNYPAGEVVDPGTIGTRGVSQMIKAIRPVKVQRGGSWFDGIGCCRSASRSGLGAKYSNKILGFRIIKKI